MISKPLSAVLVAAAAVLSLHAAADTLPQVSMKEMVDMKTVDTNKDGMVSKAEFLATMGKIYDMKVKEMGIKDGKITATQFEELRRAIWQAGGGQ